MIGTSKLIDFRSELSTYHAFSRFDVCFSHFYHNLTMLFLDSKIWMNTFKKHIKTFSSDIRFKYITSIKIFSVFRNNFNPVMYSNKIMKPFHNGFIDRSEFDNSSMGNRKYSCFSFNGIDVKTTIAVNVSSKISKIQLFHINSFTTLYTYTPLKSTLNDLASGIRKNMRKSDLIGNYEREIRRDLPAKKINSVISYRGINLSHISNRMPVLNSAAARLGQALRETQDVLQRDNLEATASVVNCVGGDNGDVPTEMALSDIDDIVSVLQGNDAEYITNMIPGENKFGKMCAEVKSSLIDLELLAA